MQHFSNELIVKREILANPSPCPTTSNPFYAAAFNGSYFVGNYPASNITFNSVELMPQLIYSAGFTKEQKSLNSPMHKFFLISWSLHALGFNGANDVIIVTQRGLSLIIALTFVLLGLWALHKNRFSAIDGGFIQSVTTKRSIFLEKERVLGGLKMEKSVNFQKPEIQYEELLNPHNEIQKNEGIKIAKTIGFGTEKEALPPNQRIK